MVDLIVTFKASNNVSDEMADAGFAVLSTSGIADSFSSVDKALCAEIFEAMLSVYLREHARSYRPEENKEIRRRQSK